MTTYTLRLRGIAVGYTELEERDPATGVACGTLRPGLGFDLVEPVFRLRADAADAGGAARTELLERYRKASEALPLELVNAAGRRVGASELVVLLPGDGEATPRLEARIEDERFWQG